MKRRNLVIKYDLQGDQNLTPQEAADFLNISVRTLAKWRCTGQENITFSKIGRSVRYKLSDLKAYQEKRTVNAEVA
jgi:excisionase family DNA binding protein